MNTPLRGCSLGASDPIPRLGRQFAGLVCLEIPCDPCSPAWSRLGSSQIANLDDYLRKLRTSQGRIEIVFCSAPGLPAEPGHPRLSRLCLARADVVGGSHASQAEPDNP